ncbi:MAG: hypothetical protein ABIP51_22165 [Bacteroidia bacterium]
MDLERYAILEKFSAYSVYIPTLLCLYRIKALNKSLWALVIYLLLCILSDQLSWFINGEYRNVLMNIFTIFEYALIVFIYYEQFDYKKIRLGIIIISITFLFLYIFILIYQKNYSSVDTILSPIESAIIAILAGSYLVKFLVDPKIEKLKKHYFYWINLGFLLYFPVAILLFLSFDFLKVCKPSTLYLVWGIHLILNTIKNILLTIGIWMKRNIQ